MQIFAAAQHLEFRFSAERGAGKTQCLLRLRFEEIDVLIPDAEEFAEDFSAGISAVKAEIVLIDIGGEISHDQRAAVFDEPDQTFHDAGFHHEKHRRDQEFVSGEIAGAFQNGQRHAVRPERTVMGKYGSTQGLFRNISGVFAESFRIVKRPGGFPVVKNRRFRTDQGSRHFADAFQLCSVIRDALEDQRPVGSVMTDHGAVNLLTVAASFPPLEIHGPVRSVRKS